MSRNISKLGVDENDDEENMYRYTIKNLDTGEVGDLRSYQPVPIIHHPLSEQFEESDNISSPTDTTVPIVSHSAVPPNRSIKDSLKSFGWRIFQGIEAIGEGVVSLLGLDDSYFQEMLDTMTEEEKRRAMLINQQREEEYRQYFNQHPDHPNHPDKMAAVLEQEEKEEQANAIAALETITAGVITGEMVLGEGNSQVTDENNTNNDDVELQLTQIQAELETTSTEPSTKIVHDHKNSADLNKEVDHHVVSSV